MSIPKRFDQDSDLERSLDRRFEQEPTYGTRPRIPLHENGALKMRFSKPPVIVAQEPAWRPSDEVAA